MHNNGKHKQMRPKKHNINILLFTGTYVWLRQPGSLIKNLHYEILKINTSSAHETADREGDDHTRVQDHRTKKNEEMQLPDG